ncbi:hypothetical protein DSO57_1009738 [Entomophthora muscae]|uniref:Uncharacterized protein n=1 Tax=Entomophthora muscae TaxID=34485 RepID=A0ACC2URZ4_9FUNG|nr:hypothetical protein DSO57_1009738 [Entomophthora muscae]
MMVKLFVLGNKETGLHFSPFAWRTIIALSYKRGRAQNNGDDRWEWKLIPVVQFDDGKIFYESFDIAVELEKRYPTPQLFPNGLTNAKFYEAYFIAHLIPVFKRVIPNMLPAFNEEDRVIFRESREASFKKTLEEFVGDIGSLKSAADLCFDPLRAALKHGAYLEGDHFSYSDVIFLGGFQWIKITTPADFKLYVSKHHDRVLKEWYSKCDEMLKGVLSSAKTVEELTE